MALVDRGEIIERLERRIKIYDKVSTSLIAIGHISITLAILMGAIGAKEISNVYWSWTSKEVWSLVIWVTFTLYLHVWLIRKEISFEKAHFSFIGFPIFILNIIF